MMIKKIPRLLLKYWALSGRFYSQRSNRVAVEHLSSRSLLKVSGKDSADFLQGLITNDMRHFDRGQNSMYTLFLNTKGRIFSDAIIYKTNDYGCFYIECDTELKRQLEHHLNIFRVRKKIVIEDVSDQLKVWSIFSPEVLKVPNALDNVAEIQNPETLTVIQNPLKRKDNNSWLGELIPNLQKKNEELILTLDPRLSLLGIRMLAPYNEDIVSNSYKVDLNVMESKLTYREFRYRLGVGEGIQDMPPGKSFPLEANGDFLHGISFHKGCYLGQELTARTYHTGVVRKRLMPVRFVVPPRLFFQDAPITFEDNETSPIGKLRGIEGSSGLALLRVDQALKTSESLKALNVFGNTYKPLWWPMEASKERHRLERQGQ